MKKLFVVFALMVVLAMSSVLVYAQQSVAGEWMMSVQGMSLKLVMAQDGEKISGILESPHGDIPLTGGFSKGKLTISGASTEKHPMQFAGTATLTADGSLSGSISANLMEMNFTAVRSPGK
jgi:hypothetical protein